MNTLQERLRANPLPLPNVMELCREAADRIDALEAENFALAAGQCAEVVGDEGGTPRCKRISELERQRYALLEACKGVHMMAACGQLDEFLYDPWLEAVADALKAAGGGK